MKPSLVSFLTTLLLLFIFSPFQAVSQTELGGSCQYYEMMERYRQQDPFDYERTQELKARARDLAGTRNLQKNSSQCCPDGVTIIPIYFHVLHNAGNPNVAGDDNFTIAEIQSVVDKLNLDYNGSNSDMNNVLQEFIDNEVVSTNTCIQFCWKTTHVKREDINSFPNSLFVSGGVVINNSFIDGFKHISPPILPCAFMNVYTSNLGGTLLGFARDMGTSGAGVYLDDNPFVPGGPLSVAPYTLGRTMTHEVGHYLGLAHIWGNTNNTGTMAMSHCGIDDGIADTPNQGRATDFAPQPMTGQMINQCGSNIMFTNFMDYSNDALMGNFSVQQGSSMVNFVNSIISTVCPNGYNEDFCAMDFNDCETPLTNAMAISACVDTTLNLLSIQNSWFAASSLIYPSPVTCYSWTLNGSAIAFPARTVVKHSNTTCMPETYIFTLWVECSIGGNNSPQASGAVSVTVYRDPNDIIEKYLTAGDCGGPNIDYDDMDCESLVTFTPINPPEFPVAESGTLEYSVSFDPSITGPCCADPCSISESEIYVCETITGPCGGIAFSGGTSQFYLGSCLSDDFSDVIPNYISSQSFFDPNGVFQGFYFFKDADLTEFFDIDTDISFSGDSCLTGTGPKIYTAVGCDNDGNGSADVIGSLGTINFTDMSVDPKAPTITMTQDGNGTCHYSWMENCFSEEFFPSSIPDQDCGDTNLGNITVEVSNVNTECVKEFEILKPDCPYCFIASCVESDFSSGSEALCSGSSLSAGLPAINISGSSGPIGDIVWLYDEDFNGPLNTFYTITNDLDLDPPAINHSDLSTGTAEDQVLYAYTLCDSDNDPSTPSVWAELGTYTVTVNPVPDSRILAVCHPGDDDNFYVEVELLSNAMANTLTATNNINASTLSFSSPGIQSFGPFVNGTEVEVTFGIDGGCSRSSGILTQSCSIGACSDPEVIFTKLCAPPEMSNFLVDVELTGTTAGLLYLATNNQDGMVLELDLLNPSGRFGPYAMGTDVQVTVSDYADSRCETLSGVLPPDCIIVGSEDLAIPESTRTFKVNALFPNPNSGMMFLDLRVNVSTSLRIEVLDLLGRTIWQSQQEVFSGDQQIEIDQRTLLPGIYLLSVEDGKASEKQFLKFVVAR